MKRIALVGDYNENVVAHRAIPIALKLATSALRADVSWEWLPSRDLPPKGAARLEPYAAVWCVPASPYENTQGVIDAIRFARVQKRPFLGTCGGFQHALLEYAEGLRYLEGELGKVLALDDAREGIAAFLGKRKPVWKGR